MTHPTNFFTCCCMLFLTTTVMTTAAVAGTMSSSSVESRHRMEDMDSWNSHISRSQETILDEAEEETNSNQGRRRLHFRRHHKGKRISELDEQEEIKYRQHQQESLASSKQAREEERRQRADLLTELYANPGIAQETTHGLMIDAGSTGSRLHVYEWAPRVLRSHRDIEDAVSGTKLSFPGTDSRWTDRLRPGLSTFATIQDDQELRQAIADYLKPLIDFAKTVLHTKEQQFAQYPIFLRATAGMRVLDPHNRSRVMSVVRDLFRNDTYCPFKFMDEQARVLSGEEESIFDWTAVNFLLGKLLEQSEGAGTVVEPKYTYGALDLGGASTQISFFEPNEDIMSNLFKLQIGQAKHWNVYAHSFLMYGMNEAQNRFHARLSADKSADERLQTGIHNPCMPGGSSMEVRTNIHLMHTEDALRRNVTIETWDNSEGFPDGFYQAVLKNDYASGDFETCMSLTKDLLHLEQNAWCRFSHKGDCGLAGIYQPDLPTQSENFGEFIAFSNFFHVWKSLQLPEKATLQQLHDATNHVCTMSLDELKDYRINVLNKTLDNEDGKSDMNTYCFRAAYAFQLLHNGYGFKMEDSIRATNVIDGHKVGWALGAMLYEINTMPWEYKFESSLDLKNSQIIIDVNKIRHRMPSAESVVFSVIVIAFFASLLFVLTTPLRRNCTRNNNRNRFDGYEPVKEVHV